MMKYRKRIWVVGVAIMALLGSATAWVGDVSKTGGRDKDLFDELGIDPPKPDDAAQCEKFTQFKMAKQALPTCRKAAEHGDAKAQFNLAFILLFKKGKSTKKDAIEAIDWLKKAAGQELTIAQYGMGMVFENGWGVSKDTAQAEKWFHIALMSCRKLVKKGNTDAQSTLAVLYSTGRGVKKDPAEALKWWRIAAKNGNVAAQNELGRKYTYGWGVKKDYAKAEKWWRKAAAQGNGVAQNSLGFKYFYGYGVKKNYVKAIKWYLKAAEQEYTSAQDSLGGMYAKGQGVKKNYTEAAKWYRKAADQGYASAQKSLGDMYDKGQGVKKDYAEAVKWYRKAAEQGNTSAQDSLGDMYDKGHGLKRDNVEALKWYRKAAKEGGGYGQYRLGLRYANGHGVKQNKKKAIELYQNAVDHGYQWAGSNLIDVYSSLLDYDNALLWASRVVKWDSSYKNKLFNLLKKDYYYGKLGTGNGFKAALKWYEGIALGDVAAQFNLGLLYNGQGHDRHDYRQAVQWWRMAADHGFAAAQYNLGVMYNKGQGVVKSGAAAADWYYKAGLSYLKEGSKEEALQSVERIKNLGSIPNAFLADKLLARIYGGGSKQASPKAKQKKTASQAVFGTGWPVAGGFVVTNHHVVVGHKKIVLLRQDGVKIPGSVAMDDATNDLVLIRVKDASQLPPALPLATGAAHAGARVFTIGYPHPDFMGSEPKVTDGLISAVTGLGNDPRTYQISVPIQAGNSGGPLLNMDGEVVGITTSKLRAAKIFKWTGDLPKNVNYAIKTGYLAMLLSSVPSSHKIPVLPVRAGNVEQLAARIEKSVLIVIAE